MQSHIILVPGFGGFDALGSLQYYDGVTEALEASRYPGFVHYFPNMPTASVLTRAQTLGKWLSKLRVRRAIRPDDSIHLIGHSTGGLDLRQLLSNLREEEQACCGAARRTTSIIKQIKTVQFLSTPHRGTALAHHLGGSPARIFASQLLLRVLYEGAHGLRGKGLWALGRGLNRLSPDRRMPNWLDAIIDTLADCYSKAGDLESAEARGTYSELLRWLLHMASDFSAITDLDPTPSRSSRASPAHASDSKEEIAFIKHHKIEVRSIVTRASPALNSKWTLFNALHRLTAHAPPWPLQRVCSIQKLWGDPKLYDVIGPHENDGLVNSVSQVWPNANRSYLVEGDHADVIGHFGQQSPDRTEPGREYDLLNAPSGFDSQQFTKLWGDIAAFTQLWEDTQSARLDAPVERQRTTSPRDTDAAPLRVCKPGK